MAKASSSKTHVTQAFEKPPFRPRWIPATIFLLIGTLLCVALVDYSPEQSTRFAVNTTSPTDTNLVGWVGADSAFSLFFAVGAGAWLVAFFLFWMFYINMKGIRRLASARTVAMFFCIVAACGLATMQDFAFTNPNIYTNGPGGELGRIVFISVLRDSMGVFGAGLLQATILILSLVFVLTRDLGAWFDRAFSWVFTLRERWRRRREAKQQERHMKDEARAKLREQASAELRKQVANLSAPPETRRLTLPKGDQGIPLPPPSTKKSLSLRGMFNQAAASQPPPPVAKGPALRIEPAAEATAAPEPKPVAAEKINLKFVTPEATRKAEKRQPREGDDYIPPPLSILRDATKTNPEMDETEHAQNAETLLRTLSEFGVEVSLGEIHIGPVITRYEVMPAPGVRVEKIAGLDKNIALGMRAQSVRILAPVPGKGVVGVEVPNKNATPVGLREILESADWVESKAELPIIIGKDVSGSPIVADLTRMPHLLIAGATGSGKSVCINSIISSLVYHAGPKKVRMLMIDPKIVELKIFNSLPHMMIPVVTEPKKVPGALKWLLSEMEKRYRIFAKVGVRNVSAFNARNSAENHVVPDEEADVHITPEIEVPRDEDVELVIPDHLPYIVCLIDELADLMMVAPAEVETSIARIAQLARAAGIHLIIATQRPSVNVITGVIKANLPSRIAFQVASKVDSRTILDTGGADQLIGRGDMLFSPPGTSRIIRAQGAFVSDDEVTAIIDSLKKNGPPSYLQEVQDHVDRDAEADSDGGSDLDESDDELFPQAIEVLKASRRASTSMLQRRLRIGYNRAARLMELLEARGIVGPENGAQPREILADLDSL